MTHFVISDSAIRKINHLNSNQTPLLMLRIVVEGGGCNGMKYQIEFTDTKDTNDLVFRRKGAVVLIDQLSINFLKNSILEYIEDLGGASFVVNNPNIKSNCGCGESFSL